MFRSLLQLCTTLLFLKIARCLTLTWVVALMERNPEPGCLFRAWIGDFDHWYFRPALFQLSNAALHYIDTLVTLVWENTYVLNADDETPEEAVVAPEIRDVSVSEYFHAQKATYKFICPDTGSLKKGQQFVLARTAREIDADFSLRFQVLAVRGTSIVAGLKSRKLSSTRKADIFEGTWVICVVESSTQQAMRHTLNAQYFAEKSVNVKLFQLLAESDSMPLREQQQCNVFSSAGRQDIRADLSEVMSMHRLNPSQQEALYYSFAKVISLVQGPPGTGKTTVCDAIVNAHHMLDAGNPKILCSAVSNYAVDHMFQKVLKSLPDQVLRSGDQSSISPWILNDFAHCVLETLSRQASVDEGYLHAETPAALKNRKTRFEPEILNKRRVVFSTLASSLSPQSMRGQVYAHVVVDESGQASEADFVGAASRACSITLVGDTQQLPPPYTHPLMQRSIMERLMLNAAFPVVVLNIQYSVIAMSCSEASGPTFFELSLDLLFIRV